MDGVGLWAPGFRDAEAWARGMPDDHGEAPAAHLLASALRRRASTVARMVAEVAGQAYAMAKVDPGRAPLVFGSALGEVRSAVEIIGSFSDEGGLPSPTRFHNSVHNAAVAYLSIATGNRKGAIAVAAGLGTATAALLEATMLLEDGADGALVVLADETIPAPLQKWGSYESAAVALFLSGGRGPRSLARLSLAPSSKAAGLSSVPASWRGNPCAPGIELVNAAVKRANTSVVVGPLGAGIWVAELETVSL